MSKFKNKYWNFRVVTEKVEDRQTFSIVRVYYKNDKPETYSEINGPLDDWTSVEALKKVIKWHKRATKRPVLDLDNWPHKYKG